MRLHLPFASPEGEGLEPPKGTIISITIDSVWTRWTDGGAVCVALPTVGPEPGRSPSSGRQMIPADDISAAAAEKSLKAWAFLPSLSIAPWLPKEIPKTDVLAYASGIARRMPKTLPCRRTMGGA